MLTDEQTGQILGPGHIHDSPPDEWLDLARTATRLSEHLFVMTFQPSGYSRVMVSKRWPSVSSTQRVALSYKWSFYIPASSISNNIAFASSSSWTLQNP